jgi:hypothetical protein
MSNKSYKYDKPEKVSFQGFFGEFSQDFEEIGSDEMNRILQINVWAYGICSSLPQTPFSPGAPYNQPGCNPG